MKRIKIILPLLLMLGVVLLLALHTSAPRPDAPRFVPAITQPTGPFGRVMYGWGDDIPFRDGKVWIFTHLSRTNRHRFHYDIDRQQVVGEAFNAGAIFANQDYTKLLCSGPDSGLTTMQTRLAALLNQISHGKLRFPTNMVETCWVLDLRDNSARRVGKFSQLPGTGSNWHPAPGFRYGYTIPTTSAAGEYVLCDLETATFGKRRFTGTVEGWWDDHQLLAANAAHDQVLLDVRTGKTATLFSAATIAARLKEFGLTNVPASINPIFNWNGRDFDVYLCGEGNNMNKYTNTTFLVKVERSGPSLKLLYRDFKFRWLGHLDASATHYLYDGESGSPGSGGNGAVFLLDLTNQTTRTIVAPGNSTGYALCRFYGDSVIYHSNGVPWRINLNSTNSTPAFPLGN